VKKGDARVLAHTKVIGGGQATSVTFKTSVLKKGEAYTFFCSFPGHSSIMKGVLKY
jgi:azurin